ncbi:transglycosylase domain-containing protein, partial [Patescibacteria group bacterium]|nr:transglycosylase domain-containing protein [Patescibacteria group bacterium]
MVGKLKQVLNMVRVGWLITGTTLLLFCSIEGIGYSLILLRDASVASSKPVDFRVEADAIICGIMGRKTGKNNDTLAPELTKHAFTLLGKALAGVGRPVYFLFVYLLLSIFFLANITGYLTRVLARFLINAPKSISKSLGKRFHKKRLKIGLLKIAYSILSSLKTSFDLLVKILTGLLIIAAFLLRHALLKLATLKPRKWLKIIKLKKRLRFVPQPKLAAPSKVKLLLFAGTLALFTGIFSSYVFWFVILSDLPNATELVTRRQKVSTKIYDRNGEILYNIYKDQNRTPVPLDRIPAQVRLATIAIEDAEFYNHLGISFRGITRAIIKIIREGELTGGSTITQQLVKNALLTPEKTLVRKLREIVLAIRVEFAYTKNEILEMYLNEVAYGGTAYGIQEAAQVYFDKNVDNLSLGEAALLAGLPKSPTRFSPFGPNPELALARQGEVLRLMRVNVFITSEQEKAAEQEDIKFSSNVTDINAPHFVMFVRQALVEKYSEEVVSQGGLLVTTTLDLNIQKLAEDVLRAEVDNLSKLNVGNGAAIVLDTQTGEILAMVGSKDYFDTESDGNVNVTTRQRQPGSSIKIVNYAYALSNGYTPLTILSDTPITFAVPGQPPYSPRNYDGKFRGKLTLRSALAESRNVPAVKVLDSYGVGNMIEQGRKMGITTWTDPSNYGLSLTLGGGEVKLIDLAQVYATVANYGKRSGSNSILQVTNYEGKVLEEGGCSGEQKTPLIALATASESARRQSGEAIKECEGEQVLDP